ncbi:N-acetyl-gamma-glutamyl-phosphate reductase [Immundisolibacter sp.]|uniref:N-acetyl-gamma-glutamyl-phosphate reductase n=1 Tax=Immundisolibacter sp. TaxID=1934948 RepID=UPI000EEFA662|nr:N-acetyl-gamma-glutamyl-phosphate reductase [Gammaproteobacteria bacterium]
MIKVGIVGGSGFTGVELLRLLCHHPQAELSVITSRSEAGQPVSSVFPSLAGRVDVAFSDVDVRALATCDVVFFATPNGVAMQQVPTLLDAGARVIDLAADFRLRDPAVWERWYGMPHACPQFLEEAVYGLPEINRDRIASARLIANPGCYPTAVTLGFLPLVEAGLVDPADLVADCKSGVSGAGRHVRADLAFCEVNENFRAYNVFAHRHQPEITQTLNGMGAGGVDLTFVPHLVPMNRGIHVTLYSRLTQAADLQAVYEARYRNEPFVRVLPAGGHPQTGAVRAGNDCVMAVHGEGRRVVVLSVIDNLVKGAAGQAIQNMNLMFGLDETCGLRQPALAP